MLNTHAPVSAPPRKHPPADERAARGVRTPSCPPRERASDAARTRNPLEGTSLKQVHRQTCPALAALQTTVAQSLSSSVAQPSPPHVARRSAQKEGRARVQEEGQPLPARRGADFAGHAGARHLVHNSGLSSKHAALVQHAANNGRAFRTKQCARRRRLRAGIAATISAAEVNETASDCAPLGQKDAAGNSTMRSDGITRELVEGIVLESVRDTVQQPSKDFAAQVPTRSSEFGRKYAHKTVRNSVSVCSAHSAASEHAALRHCRQEDVLQAVEACRTRTRRQHHGLCLSASRGLLVAMALLVRLCHTEAAFTPRNRAELQGGGTAGGGGVFGCVGECGDNLLTHSFGYTYCYYDANGPWESGDGTTCANADSDVPSGQGDGKYGAIGSWNVGKVTDMGYSECPSLSLFHF